MARTEIKCPSCKGGLVLDRYEVMGGSTTFICQKCHSFIGWAPPPDPYLPELMKELHALRQVVDRLAQKVEELSISHDDGSED